MTGYIHSIQSLGTLDGPGVRAVVFASGCPLRCAYCHNPDTWGEGEATSAEELTERILRLYPYIKNGGVTFSGGEPLLQADFFAEVAASLSERGLHIACDTSGSVPRETAERLLAHVDLVILDIKFTTEEEYRTYTGGSLGAALDILRLAESLGKEVWIRQVILPGVNDTEKNALALAELLRPHRRAVSRVELLPFRKLCLEKYEALGIPFPLSDMPEASQKRCDELLKTVLSELKK